MSDLFLERSFDPGLDKQGVIDMALASGWCFEMYKVDWHGSLLSSDGHSMICHFSSTDAESIRNALRQSGADMQRMWVGTVHEVPEPGTANVVVERTFDEPVALEDLQAVEDANSHCLETHHVKFVRTFFSGDNRRMLCLYSAPDAESVRIAQREAGMPVDRVWAFERIAPEDLSS